jgi:hypothetical protein
MGDVTADEFLAAAVVDGGVDQVDASVKHGIEEFRRLCILNRRARGLSPQLHGSVSEDCHVGTGTPERPGFDRHPRQATQDAVTGCPCIEFASIAVMAG